MRRILIDECINPRVAVRLRSGLPESSVNTVGEIEWAGRRDHHLISEIEARFDVFPTIDKALSPADAELSAYIHRD
jgi:hypothetical protein